MTCLAPAPEQRSGPVQFDCRCVMMGVHSRKASRPPVSRTITWEVIVRPGWASDQLAALTAEVWGDSSTKPVTDWNRPS
jgi:hypothetical protein